MGDGVGVGDGTTVGDGVGVGDGPTVGDGVGVGDGTTVGDGAGVGSAGCAQPAVHAAIASSSTGMEDLGSAEFNSGRSFQSTVWYNA